MEDKIINVLKNIKSHIIYDKNINQICFSAEFVKIKNEIIKIIEERRTQNNE